AKPECASPNEPWNIAPYKSEVQSYHWLPFSSPPPQSRKPSVSPVKQRFSASLPSLRNTTSGRNLPLINISLPVGKGQARLSAHAPNQRPGPPLPCPSAPAAVSRYFLLPRELLEHSGGNSNLGAQLRANPILRGLCRLDVPSRPCTPERTRLVPARSAAMGAEKEPLPVKEAFQRTQQPHQNKITSAELRLPHDFICLTDHKVGREAEREREREKVASC
uniref:Uncharacterized protein n=1 Tax=Mustela putorius furo TaxID=9669 RepID=M3XSR5_MUSPF